MRNRMYGGVRGRKTKVGEKLLRFPPTRFTPNIIRCLFFIGFDMYLLSEKDKKVYFFPAIKPLMTALVNPFCSMVLRPLMVQPPGVVTLSMAASGCSPVS